MTPNWKNWLLADMAVRILFGPLRETGPGKNPTDRRFRRADDPFAILVNPPLRTTPFSPRASAPLRRGDACVAPTTPWLSRYPGTGVSPPFDPSVRLLTKGDRPVAPTRTCGGVSGSPRVGDVPPAIRRAKDFLPPRVTSSSHRTSAPLRRGDTCVAPPTSGSSHSVPGRTRFPCGDTPPPASTLEKTVGCERQPLRAQAMLPPARRKQSTIEDPRSTIQASPRLTPAPPFLHSLDACPSVRSDSSSGAKPDGCSDFRW